MGFLRNVAQISRNTFKNEATDLARLSNGLMKHMLELSDMRIKNDPDATFARKEVGV